MKSIIDISLYEKKLNIKNKNKLYIIITIKHINSSFIKLSFLNIFNT